MLTVTIWPQAPDLTRLVSEWHFHPDEIATPGFVCDDAIDFWDRTNREDWAISERSYRGISSRGYAPGPYSNRERQLWEFDQFVIKKVGPDLGRVAGLVVWSQPRWQFARRSFDRKTDQTCSVRVCHRASHAA